MILKWTTEHTIELTDETYKDMCEDFEEDGISPTDEDFMQVAWDTVAACAEVNEDWAALPDAYVSKIAAAVKEYWESR